MRSCLWHAFKNSNCNLAKRAGGWLIIGVADVSDRGTVSLNADGVRRTSPQPIAYRCHQLRFDLTDTCRSCWARLSTQLARSLFTSTLIIHPSEWMNGIINQFNKKKEEWVTQTIMDEINNNKTSFHLVSEPNAACLLISKAQRRNLQNLNISIYIHLKC